MPKEFTPFPGVVCQRLRNLVDLKKGAIKKRQDLFDERDNAEETLNSTPSTNESERSKWQAKYGQCVLDINRWNKAIRNIENQVDELVEKADEPGLFDEAKVHIDEFFEKAKAKADADDDEDPDQTRIPGTEKDTRPVGRKHDAPVAVGENQHLAASITELGLPDHVCANLKKQGFETVNHLVLHQNKGKKFIEIHMLSEVGASEIEKALSTYLKAHTKAQIKQELGGGDEPVRNTRGGPRVGTGAPKGKTDRKKASKK